MPTRLPFQLALPAAARPPCLWTRTHLHQSPFRRARRCHLTYQPRLRRRRPSCRSNTRQLRRRWHRLRRRHLPCRRPTGRRRATAPLPLLLRLLPPCRRRRRRPCWISQGARSLHPSQGRLAAEPCGRRFSATCWTIFREQLCTTGGRTLLPHQRQPGDAPCSTTSPGRPCSGAAPRAGPAERPATLGGLGGVAADAPSDRRHGGPGGPRGA